MWIKLGPQHREPRQVSASSARHSRVNASTTWPAGVYGPMRPRGEGLSSEGRRVLTIALGVGLNASFFSIFNSLLLKPLQGPEARTLVSLYATVDCIKNRNIYGDVYRLSYPQYLAFRDINRVYTGLAAFTDTHALLDDRAQESPGQIASCNYFSVLQPAMTLGRGFTESECTGKASANVVVLGNTEWRERYASSSAIIIGQRAA